MIRSIFNFFVFSTVFMFEKRSLTQAIGNHEFDNGPSNLVRFLNQANFSAVCSNMDVSGETNWPNPPIYVPSMILERGGKKIGIIGYTTPDTAW